MPTIPSDYDKKDGWNPDNGVEECPHCGKTFTANGGHAGPVFDKSGREYEYHLDTDPGDGPFFCPDCWKELDANRKASENKSIGDYA